MKALRSTIGESTSPTSRRAGRGKRATQDTEFAGHHDPSHRVSVSGNQTNKQSNTRNYPPG